MKKFSTINSSSKDINPYWEYRVDTYVLPDGDQAQYYYCNTNDSVLVIPIWADGKVSICKQYRYLMKGYVYELCGGAMADGETALEAAKKELREELGIVGSGYKVIGGFNPYKGVTNETCWVVLCDAIGTTSTDLEQSEEIERIDIGIDDLYSWLMKSEVCDGMSIAAANIFNHSHYYNSNSKDD